MPKVSVKVPKGFPRDSTNLKVKQADAVMLSYPLGVQYHRRCASATSSERHLLAVDAEVLTTTSTLAVQPQHMDGHTDSLAQKCTSRKARAMAPFRHIDEI